MCTTRSARRATFSSCVIVIVVTPPSRGQVLVQVGSARVNVSLASLQRAPTGAQPSRRASPAQKHAESGARRGDAGRAEPAFDASPEAPRALRTEDNTCDLRGMRVEEALERVEEHLDRLLGGNERAGFVLHGHGTGALRSAVRAHLASSRYVAEVRGAGPDEGGDAFTVFWLAD